MSLSIVNRGGASGGLTGIIRVTGLSEADTVTATKDGKTVNLTWMSDGYHEVAGMKELGDWTVTATNGVKTKTQVVKMDAVGLYEIYMPYIMWLYRAGDECKEVTGGWETWKEGGTQGSLTKNADHMVIYYNQIYVGTRTVNKAILNRGYSTLCAEVRATQDSFSSKNFCIAAIGSSMLEANVTSSSYYTQKIDISALKDKTFYVRIWGQYYSRSSGYLYVKNVWLE